MIIIIYCLSIIIYMYILFTILLSMQLIFAEAAYSISGTVINEQGLPVENVSVKIEDLDLGSTTDASGYFLLQFQWKT